MILRRLILTFCKLIKYNNHHRNNIVYRLFVKDISYDFCLLMAVKIQRYNIVLLNK